MSSIRNLVHSYGDFHLNIPHWEIADQGVTALIGPSGAGKSSLLRILLGLDLCREMQWSFREGESEIDLNQLSIEDRRIGVVFQDYLLFPHLSGLQNIEFAARARKIPGAELQAKLAEWTQVLKLETFWNRKAMQLSGGEQQRIALVRALVGRPRLLFLDEPFSSLDPELRRESRFWVQNLIHREKIPVVLVTHDREDVEVLAQHVVRLQAGQIKTRGGQ